MAIMLGLLLGLAYALTPGAVNVETVRRGSSAGFRAAIAVQAGAIAADLAYAVSTSLGIATVLARPLPHTILGVVGTALLLAFGIVSVRSGWRGAVPPVSVE